MITYHGFWKNDVKWGFGIETRTTDNIVGKEEVYEGMFANGFYHGIGRLKYSDGSYFYGTFRYGKKYGKTLAYDN